MAVPLPAPQGFVFWIVQISVRNVTYSNPITGRGWRIVANSTNPNVPWQLYGLSEYIRPATLNIPPGQGDQVTMVFPVPVNVSVEDAQICYVGQDPNSFGKLTKANTVVAYDWSTGSVINLTPTPTTKAGVAPSKADVENVALHADVGLVYCTVTTAVVMQIGQPATLPAPFPVVGTIKAWPAEVNVTCQEGGSRSVEIWVYKNQYGNWDLAASGW